jgi:hypothetical protein
MRSAECGSADVGGDGERMEFCWRNFCSHTPGKMCLSNGGGPCESSNCRYRKVNDPNGTCIPGGGPSCAVGCN